MSLGLLSLGGLDMKPAMDALREVALNPDDPSPAILRRLLPVLSTMRLDNLEGDVPTDEPGSSPTAPGSRVRFDLGRFEIVSEKPINGIPTNLRIGARNLVLPIPPNSDNPGFAMLADLGYEKLDGSFGINLGWNEAGEELLVRDVSIEGRDVGSASLRAVIGRVRRDIFDMDTAIASVAALSAGAKSIELAIDNKGLFERIIARESRRQKRPAEDVRREYGMAAAMGVPAVLGSGPAAKTIAQAVSRFVAKPGRLTIQARAKQGTVGVAEYAANPNPAALLDALDVTATAE